MLGPDYKRPEFVVEPDADFENVPDNWPDPNITDTVGPWWQTFKDPILDDLVTTALENNNDLKSAAARVLESQALLDQSHGIRFPQVAYSADRTRAKTVFNLGGDTIGTLATSYSHGLSINYMVDFFGKLKRAERAALDDFLAATENQNALVHSIIAQVVASRVQIDTRQQLLDIANANIESWKKTLNIIETRYSRGLVTSLDVHLAREKLASAQATALQLRQSVILASHGIDVLLGKRPATSEPLPDSVAQLLCGRNRVSHNEDLVDGESPLQDEAEKEGGDRISLSRARACLDQVCSFEGALEKIELSYVVLSGHAVPQCFLTFSSNSRTEPNTFTARPLNSSFRGSVLLKEREK